VKRAICLLILSLACGYLHATTVTGTITYSDSQALANAIITANFVANPTGGIAPGQYRVSGNTFTQTVVATANSSGAFSMTLSGNDVISPGGSFWAFNVCVPASSPCFNSGNISITGSSQSVSTQLSTAAGGGGGPPGVMKSYYADGEVTPAVLGATYYNLISNTFRCYSGSWGVCGSGGTASSVPFSGVTNSTNNNALMVGNTGTFTPVQLGQISGTGLWLNWAVPGQPFTTTVNSTGGTFLSGHGVYIRVSFNNGPLEGPASGEILVSLTSGGCTTGSACQVVLTAPSLPPGITGYTVYPSDNVSGAELQLTGCVNITGNCTINAAGTGSAPLTYATATLPKTPASLGTNGLCTNGLTPWLEVENDAGTYDLQGGIDPTVYTNMPGNHLTFCNPIFFSNGTSLPQGGHNNVVTVYDYDGQGIDHTTNDNRSFGCFNVIDSNYSGGSGSSQICSYNESDLLDDPSLYNDIIAPLNESVDGGAFTIGDARTGCGANCGGPFAGLRGSYTFTGVGGPSNWTSTMGITAVGIEGSAQVDQVPTSAMEAIMGGHFDWISVSTTQVGEAVAIGADFPSSSSYLAGANAALQLRDLSGTSTGNTSYGVCEGYLVGASCRPEGSGSTLRNQFNGYTWFQNGFGGGAGVTTQVVTPTNGTVGCTGGSGGAYGYKITGTDVNGAESPLSSQQAQTCASTLNGTDYTEINVSAVSNNTGLVNCNVYRTESTGTPSSLGYIGTITPCFQGATFNDTGIAATTSDTGPASNVSGSLSGFTYRSNTNCKVNSSSPGACGSSAAGTVVVPTTTTSYTIDTTAITASSEIFLQYTTDATGLASSPTCVAPATLGDVYPTARVAGTSFTFVVPSTTGTLCVHYFIMN
jgi:hypothetical protein